MSSVPIPFSAPERRERFLTEFRVALAATSSRDLTDWGVRSAANTMTISRRRVESLGDALTGITKALLAEAGRASAAARGGQASAYLNDIKDRLSGAVTNVSTKAKLLWSRVQKDPRQAATEFVTVAIGFYLGAGGVDGDGGVPDLDSQFGIGAHRSILTHSVLSGIAIESVCFAVVDLARVLHEKLPPNHDALWDQMLSAGGAVAAKLTSGISLGIAYHLGIDATIDGEGTYKDLPISLPEVGHQTIAAVNAAAEALDAGVRPGSIVASYPSFQAAARMARRAKSTSFKVRRSGRGTSFDVVYAPRGSR